MIDLHLHTTASDGRLSPDELVRRADGVGIRVMAVADHDTMASVAAATRAAAALGISVVPGIEITSVLDGRDVHILGYYLDPDDPALHALLEVQRRERLERAREIGRRLAGAGATIDVEPLLREATARGASVARPQIAAALVAAGHAADIGDAFDRWLSEGRPAFVPHVGREPAHVVSVIAGAGGAASMAHPGTTGRDEIIPQLAEAGLAALEAYHSAHDAVQRAHYIELARRHGLALTGGSDFHGDGMRRAEFFGVVSLPEDEFERFRSRALARRA
jgi:predicted metal-dependent phosphoesterase TrpH